MPPPLSNPITRTYPRPSTGPRRLLLVRQPLKTARAAEPSDRLPMRLWIGVIAGVGVILLVWLIGHLGYRLGYAPLVRVPDLVGDPGSGLATGALVLLSIPRAIFHAGMAEPLWLMLGFAMISIPAASLGAARPHVPGGPRLKPGLVAIAATGAVCAVIAGATLIWWTGSSIRLGLLRPLPLAASEAMSWHDDLLTAAGLDVLGVIAAALWLVLIFRLPIATWLRALSLTAAFFTLVVMIVAMAISNTTAAQALRPRALVDDENGTRVILGATPHHLASLVAYGDEATVELRNHPELLVVRDRMSLVDYLAHHDATRKATGN